MCIVHNRDAHPHKRLYDGDKIESDIHAWINFSFSLESTHLMTATALSVKFSARHVIFCFAQPENRRSSRESCFYQLYLSLYIFTLPLCRCAQLAQHDRKMKYPHFDTFRVAEVNLQNKYASVLFPQFNVLKIQHAWMTFAQNALLFSLNRQCFKLQTRSHRKQEFLALPHCLV